MSDFYKYQFCSLDDFLPDRALFCWVHPRSNWAVKGVAECLAVRQWSQNSKPLRGMLVIYDLVSRVFFCVPGAPGQCITDEKQLHVIKRQGRKSMISILHPPLIVRFQGHAKSSMVRQVFTQRSVTVHLGVGN